MLQLYDILIRCLRSGDVQVVKVALLCSDLPFCVSFLATLGATSAARGGVWRRAFYQQREASNLDMEKATKKHHQLTQEHTRVCEEHDRVVAEHMKLVEEHDKTAFHNRLAAEKTKVMRIKLEQLQAEVESVRNFENYTAFSRSRTAWSRATRDGTRGDAVSQARAEYDGARGKIIGRDEDPG